MSKSLSTVRDWLEIRKLREAIRLEYLSRSRDSDHVLTTVLREAYREAQEEEKLIEGRLRAFALAQGAVYSPNSVRRPAEDG